MADILDFDFGKNASGDEQREQNRYDGFRFHGERD